MNANQKKSGAIGMDFSSRPWLIRTCVNFTYVGVCLAVTLIAKHVEN
jgi:hypothetical protein